jgi:Calpain family cysteine protease
VIAGYIDSALRDLTGLPTLTYQLAYSMVPPNLRRLWASEYGGARVYTKEEVVAAKAAGGKDPNTIFTKADDAASEDALWRRLSSLKQHGALIGCSHRCVGVAHDAEECDEAFGDDDGCEPAPDERGEEELDDESKGDVAEKKDPETPAVPTKWRRTVNLRCMSAEEAKREGIRGPSGVEAPIKGYGIMQRHAYSLVDLKEVAGYRLVRVRNPWGVGEWTGAWSDKVRHALSLVFSEFESAFCCLGALCRANSSHSIARNCAKHLKRRLWSERAVL